MNLEDKKKSLIKVLNSGLVNNSFVAKKMYPNLTTRQATATLSQHKKGRTKISHEDIIKMNKIIQDEISQLYNLTFNEV